MKQLLILVTLILLIGLAAVPALAAENSITVNPWGLMNGAYIVDFEHSIEGGGGLNGCVAIYDSDSGDLSGHSLSASFHQYFESDAQGGRYFGLSASYYDVSKAKDIWFIDEGTGYGITFDYGYRRIYDSGFTMDLGFGVGIVKRDDENHLLLTGKLQTGYGW